MTVLRWRSAILPALLAVLCFVASPRPAASQESPTLLGVPGDPSATRETLDYSVEWRLVTAGTAKVTWTAPPRPAAPSELRMHLESAGLVSRLFRVEDEYSAVLGQSFCVQSTFMSAKEGSRNRETRVTFDPQSRKASYLEKDLNKNASTARDVDIPPCVHDVLSGLLVLRNMSLEPGKAVQVPISDGKKFAQVRVESQRREELNTPLGLRKTIRYEVFLFDNVLYRRSGHFHVWLTDDARRLPVQLQAHLQFTIGTITFRLEKEEKQ